MFKDNSSVDLEAINDDDYNQIFGSLKSYLEIKKNYDFSNELPAVNKLWVQSNR